MTGPAPTPGPQDQGVALWSYVAEVAGDVEVGYLVQERSGALVLVLSHEWCGDDVRLPVNRDGALRLHHQLGRYLEGLPPDETML